MSPRATDAQRASAAEHYALRFPSKKAVRMRRYLKHFDQWLRATFKISINDPIPLAFPYKQFFLSHIALFPATATRDRFLSEDLDRDLQQLGLIDAGELSCRQVFARMLSALRWQKHQFNTNTHELMSELVPFYRRLSKVVRAKELTYKSALQPETILKVFRRHQSPGPHEERDAFIMSMIWGLGCTPAELINLSFEDFDVLSPLDWVYCRQDTQDAPMKLDHITALSMLSLVCENYDLMGYDPELLLNCRDGLAWRSLTESDIEVIIERHYRFAGALYGFDQYTSPDGRLTADLLPWEEAMYTDALETFTNQIFTILHRSRTESNEEQHDDWDAAILKRAALNSPAEHEPRDADEVQQVDWDAAIRNPK